MSYKAIICKLENVRPHPNGQFIQLANCCGSQVIVGLNSKNNDLGIYFDTDGQLSLEYTNANKLIGYIDETTGERKNGYFSHNRRVKCQKFRGEKSEGYFAPLSSLEFTGYNIATLKIGDRFDKLGIIPICNKYVTEGSLAYSCQKSYSKMSTFSKYLYGFVKRVFPEHPDTDQLKHCLKNIEKGSLVTITSKLHGTCLINNTKISMADGSKKNINKVKIGDLILGYGNNSIKIAKVLNVINNGKNTEGWIDIRYSRKGCGLGNSFGNVTCTHDHLIYSFSKNKYIKAKEIIKGESVGILLQDRNITDIQKQIMIGKLLGDGSLRQNDSSAKIYFSHKEEHRDYLQWFTDILGDLMNPKICSNIVSGFGTKMVRMSTRYNKFIKLNFSSWVNKKDIPYSIINEIEPLGLAIWYMDDGSLSHNNFQEDRVAFAICSVEEDKLFVIDQIFRKFNIIPTFYTTINKGNNKKQQRVRLNKDEANKFFELIYSYIPPIMQYKLPLQYRNKYQVIPVQTNKIDCLVKKVSIIDISFIDSNKPKSLKWDIQTETSNFFANGMLVHNSGRAAHVPVLVKLNIFQKILNKLFFNNRTHTKYEIWQGTRRVLLRPNTEDSYYKDTFRNKVLEKLKPIINKNYIFYYEIVGYTESGKSLMNPVEITKIKDENLKRFSNPMIYKYGCLQGECDFYIYRVTTINPDGIQEELSWNRIKRLCKESGIKHVPEIDSFIYDGNIESFSKYIEYLTEHKPIEDPIDNSHIREGICIRIDSPDGRTKIYKNKLFLFRLLESTTKDSGAIDIEEVEDLKKGEEV